jgi:hypothetical protein
MAAFTDLLRGLFEEGSARLRAPPLPEAGERAGALAVLEAAFRDHRLDVAGPAIDFDASAALAAAEFTALACWFLVHRGAQPAEVERALKVPAPPRTAGQHLSADVVFRLLPTVHRRAQALDPRDVLTARLEELLRQWPLSGVLAELEEPPLEPVDLGGHPGLLLLYAERLALRPRPAWALHGPAWEYVELVFSEKGMPTP